MVLKSVTAELIIGTKNYGSSERPSKGDQCMPMHNLTATLSGKRMKYRCGRRIWLNGVTNE